MSAPALRFKGFFDDWTEKKIGEIAPKVGSGSTPRGGEEVYQNSGVPFIRSQNVNNDCLLLEEITFIPDEVHSRMKGSTVKPNDILLNITGASIGRSCVVPDNFETGNVNQHVCIIRLNDGYEPKFIQPYLSSSRGQKTISSTQVGSGREGLNFEAIRSFKVFTPSKAEQTKIANFLTAVDEKLAQITRKHDLLTQYKKGVMQQIFSQKLRFKPALSEAEGDDDGRKFAEWEDVTLDELLDYEQPTKYLVASTKYSDKFKTPVLTAGKTFILGYTDETAGILTQGLPVIIFDDFTTAFKFVPFPFKAKSSAMKILRLKGATNSIQYIYAAMQLIDFPCGDEHKRYWISEYSKISISLPCVAEQTKIANFLASIDEKVTTAKNQLEAVKQYKQGLLQQMFV